MCPRRELWGQGRARSPQPWGRVRRSPPGPRRCLVCLRRAASGPGGAAGSWRIRKSRAENAVEGRWKRAPGAGGSQGIAPASAPRPGAGVRASPGSWRLRPGAAAASLDLSLLAPEKAVQVLFSGTAPGLRDPRPKMLSNAADSQKAISYLLSGLFQGTPAWQRLASLQPPRLTKSKRWPRRLCPPPG